eukprot:1658381-Amphidinium_carterae.1
MAQGMQARGELSPSCLRFTGFAMPSSIGASGARNVVNSMRVLAPLTKLLTLVLKESSTTLLANTVLICNGIRTKQKLWQVWRAGRVLPASSLPETLVDT